MPARIHFISGLPRSGSTLLAAMLRQNPRFHAAVSSPVASLFTRVLAATSAANDVSVFWDEAKKVRVLKSVFDAWYEDCGAERGVIFDTNRVWCARLPVLEKLFPESKVICCVRNVAWIMDSIERLVRRNALDVSQLFNDAERDTVYTRVEALAQYDRLVGFAWAAVKEAFYSEQAGRLLLVDYELLAQAPENTLRLVYEFLGEPWFEHDFEHLDYSEPAFDGRLGTPGLHDVRGAVRFAPRRTVLPPDLFERYRNLSFWQDSAGSAAHVITPKASMPPDVSADIARRTRGAGSTTTAADGLSTTSPSGIGSAQAGAGGEMRK